MQRQCGRKVAAILVQQRAVVQQHRHVGIALWMQRLHRLHGLRIQRIGARQVLEPVRGVGQVGQQVGAVVGRCVGMRVEPGLAAQQPGIGLAVVLAYQEQVAEVAERAAVQRIVIVSAAFERGDHRAETGFGLGAAILFHAQVGDAVEHAQGADVVLAECGAAFRQRARQLRIRLLQPVAAEHAVADAETDLGGQVRARGETRVDGPGGFVQRLAHGQLAVGIERIRGLQHVEQEGVHHAHVGRRLPGLARLPQCEPGCAKHRGQRQRARGHTQRVPADELAQAIRG